MPRTAYLLTFAKRVAAAAAATLRHVTEPRHPVRNGKRRRVACITCVIHRKTGTAANVRTSWGHARQEYVIARVCVYAFKVGGKRSLSNPVNVLPLNKPRQPDVYHHQHHHHHQYRLFISSDIRTSAHALQLHPYTCCSLPFIYVNFMLKCISSIKRLLQK